MSDARRVWRKRIVAAQRQTQADRLALGEMGALFAANARQREAEADARILTAHLAEVAEAVEADRVRLARLARRARRAWWRA